MFRLLVPGILGAMGLLVFLVHPISAQSTSQFPNDPPGAPGTNWVGTSGATANGDQDQVVVIFFEIPDTTTSTLYFGINDPANTGSPPYDQAGTAGEVSSWYLIGGTGALSNPLSQQLTYPATPTAVPLVGTQLSAFVEPNATTGTNDTGWVYFSGVQPSQGEHIGDKYYFKIVLEVNANVGKNAFQADVSVNNSGSPTGVSGARSFAYAWTPFMSSNTAGSGRTFDFYPFVPSAFKNGSLVLNAFDFDNGGSGSVFDTGGTLQQNITITAQSAIDQTFTFPIGAATNGTWRAQISSPSNGGTAYDLDEVYFNVGSTYLRTYSSPVPAQTADHITSTYGGGTVSANGSSTARVVFQVVDSSGNPQLVSKNIYVDLSSACPSGACRIAGASSTGTTLPAQQAVITTDGNGLAWIDITDNLASGSENVTFAPVTDGVSGTATPAAVSDNLPGVNNSVSIPFAFDPPPEISSASNTTFAYNASSPQALPPINITDSGASDIGGANNFSIIIPASFGATFDTTVNSVTGTGANAGSVSVTYTNGDKTAVLHVSGAPLATGTTTLSGLALAAPFSASTGSLGIAWNGSTTTAQATDDKTITITAPLYTWNGSAGSSWTTGANWTPTIMGGPPATANVRIPVVTGPSVYPVVASGTITTKDLIIDYGASMTLNGASGITVNGAFANSGTFTLNGDEAVALTNSTTSGTIDYAGSGAYTGLALGSVYNNITFSGTGSYTLTSDLTVNGTFAQSAGTVQAGSHTLTVGGNWSHAGGSFTAGSSTIRFAGSSTSQITGATTFATLSCSTPGKTLQFQAGQTQTVMTAFDIAGTSSPKVLLRSTVTGTQWTLALPNGVSTAHVTYADVQDSYAQATPAGTVNATYSVQPATSPNNTNWSFQSFVEWTGATSTSWNTAGNWSPAAVPTSSSNVAIVPATNEPVLDVAANVNSLSISSGASLDLNGLSLTMAAAGAIIDNGILRLQGGETLSGVTGITGGGVVDYYGGASYTIKNFGAIGYPSLEITGGGSYSLGAALTVSKDLTVSAGALAAGGNAISLGGSLNLTGATSFSGTGTITMTPTTGVSLRSGGQTLASLSVGGVGSVTLGGPLSLSGSLSVSGGSRLTLNGNDLAVGGSLSNAGTLDNTGAGSITAGGSVTMAGGSYLAGGGSFTFDGGTTQNLTPGGQNLGAVATTTSSTSVVLQGALVVASATIGAGTVFDLNGFGLQAAGTLTDGGTLRLEGSESVNLGAFAPSTGLVDYYGTTGPYLSLAVGSSYYDLSFTGSGAGASWKAAAGVTVGRNLTIGGGATFDLAGQALSVVGAATDSGTLRLEGGEAVALGSFVPGTGTVVYYGNGGSTAYPSLAVGGSYTNLTFQTAGTNTWATTGSTIVAGTLTLTSGGLLMGTNGLSVAGNISRGSGTITSSGTVTLNGGGAQLVDFAGSTLSSLTVTNSSASGATLSAATTLGGALTVTAAGAYLLTGGNNLSVAGAVDITNGKLDLGSGGTLTIGGNLSLGTLTSVTGTTLVLDGTSGTQVVVPNAQTFGAVDMTGTGGVALTGTATFGSLQVGSGETFTSGGAATTALTVSGGLTNGGILSLSSTASGAPSTLTMGAGTTIANTGTLQVASSASTVTLTSSGSGTTLTGAQVSLGGNSLSLGYFTTALPLTLGASEQLTLVGPATFGGLVTLNGASSTITTGSNALSATGGLTVTNGTVNLTGSGSVASGSASVTVGSSGTLVLDSTASPTVSCGGFTSSGTVTNTAPGLIAAGGGVTISGTFSTPANNTITMSGNGSSIDASATLGSLGIASGVSVSVANNPVDLAGSLTVASSGALSLGGNNLTVAGSVSGAGSLTPSGSEAISAGTGWSVAGFTPQTTQVTFGGGTVTPGSYDFYDAVFSGAVTLGADLTALHDISISASTGSIAAGTTTMTVGGSWTNNRGAAGYTASGAGSVVFDDSAQTAVLSGTTSFNNLACTTPGKTIQFPAGSASITAVAGSFTMTGGSGGVANFITLESQTPGSQWYFSVGGTPSVSYASVYDSNYSVPSIDATHSWNATPANNTNWTFAPSNLSWTGAVSSAWHTGGNWSEGYVPNATDNATVGSGTNHLDLGGLSSATTAITGLTVTGTVDASSAGSLDVRGSLAFGTGAAVAAPAGATWVMSGAGATLSSSLAGSIGSLTVQPGAGNAVTLSSPLVLNALDLVSGTFAASTQALTVSGNISRTSGALTSSGTITLDGGTAQTVDFTGSSIGSLSVSNTATTAPPQVVLSNASGFGWSGGLTIASGTVQLPAVSQTIGGDVSGAGTLDASTIAAGNTLTVGGYLGTSGTPLASLTAPAGALDVGSSWDVTSFNANGGTVVFSATGTIYSAASFASLSKTTGGTMGFASGVGLSVANNLVVSGGTLTLANAAGAQSVGGNVSGAGILDASAIATGNSLTVGGSIGTSGTPFGTLSAPAGTLDVGTDWNVTSFTANAGTVAFTGTGTIYSASAFGSLARSGPGTTSFNTGVGFSASGDLTIAAGSLVLANVAGTQSVGGSVSGAGTLNASAIAAGNGLSIGGSIGTSGTPFAALSAPAGTLDVGTDWNVTSFNSNGGTVAFSGSGTIYSTASFAGLSKSTGGTTSFNSGIALSVANNLSVTGGTLALADIAGTQSVGGNVSGAGALDASAITAGNTLSVAGYVGTAGTPLASLAAPAGTLSVAGDFDVGSFAHDNGTVLFNGPGTQNVAAATFYRLTMNKPSASVLTPANPGASNDWTVQDALTLTSGTLNPVNGTGNTIVDNGPSWDDSAANVTFAATGGTVELGGTGAVSVASKAGNHFSTLVVGSGSSATAATQTTSLSVTGALTIAASASLATGANSLAVGGLVSGAGTLTATNAVGTPAVSAASIGTTGNALGALSAPSGATAITVASDWNVGSYTPNGETVTFTGSGTVYSSTLFSNLTKSGAGTTSFSGAPLTVTGTLTISGGSVVVGNVAGNSVGGSATGAGSLDASAITGANVLTIGGDFSLATLSAPASTVSIGGSAVTFSSLTANGGTVNLDAATGPVALTTGGVGFASLSVSGAGPKTVTLSGALIASGNLQVAANNVVTLANVAGNAVAGSVAGGGTVDASAVASTLSFTVGGSLGVSTYAATPGTTYVGGDFSTTSFSDNGGLVDFDGSGAQSLDATGGAFQDLTKSNGTLGSYLSVIAGALQVNGTLTTATANDSIDLGAQDFTIGTLDNNGRILLAGNQTVQTITSPDSAKGLIVYAGAAGGTVRLSSFYDLSIAGSGTFALAGPIAVRHNLFILSGTLDAAGNASITLGGAAGGSSFNQIGGPYGTFNPEQGTVNLAGAGPFTIAGSNSFYNLAYTNSSTSQAVINVETGTTQTIVAGGTLTLHGNAAYTPTATGSILVQSTGHTGAANAPAIRWTLAMTKPSTLDLAYVTIWDSVASPTNISPPANVLAGGPENDYNWFGRNYVIASSTVDSDNDGKIDAIKVTTQYPVDDQFGGFRARVVGYTVTGYSTGTSPLDDVFYIDLSPGPKLDTAARPVWYIEANTTLLDTTFGTDLVALSNPASGQVPDDGAAPTVGYTLAVAGKSQIYIRFSEPVVESPGGGPLAASDFSYSGAASVTSITRLVQSGNGTSSLLIDLSGAVTASEELTPATVTVAPVEDLAATPNQMPAADLTHRVSDLGLGLPGEGIVEPLWAKNDVTVDAARGGLGSIHAFDGSAWLQPDRITLQGVISPGISATSSSPSVSLYFDDNVPSSLKVGSLWLPPHDASLFDGIVATPNASAASVTGSDIAGNPQIRDFVVPSGNAKLVSSSTLEFLFAIDGANPLFCARLTDPAAADWYDRIAPWSFSLHTIIAQRGEVTILNNVINASRGQKAYLNYRITSTGTVTINVFNLAGSLVDVLERGIQGAGNYSTSWDGHNFSGRVVARGIYFIRVVAPGIDQYRKVMVVR